MRARRRPRPSACLSWSRFRHGRVLLLAAALVAAALIDGVAGRASPVSEQPAAAPASGGRAHASGPPSEPRRAPARATDTITPGGPPVTVTIATAGTSAQVTWTANAGDKVSLEATNSTITRYQIKLLKPDGSTLVSSSSSLGTGNSYAIDATTLPVAGTYTLKVIPASTYTGSVTLTLYSVVDATGTTTPDGGPFTITTTVPGQQGLVTFSGVAGRRISITSDHVAISGARVSVLSPGGGTLAAETSYLPSNYLPIDAVALPTTGTYTIVLDATGDSTGSATLSLHDVPADVDDTIAVDGISRTETITTPGQNAAVHFSGLPTEPIKFTISGTSSCHLKILNPDGSANWSSSTLWCASSRTLTTTLTATGTYTLSIDPYVASTGTVTLTLELNGPWEPPEQTYGSCTDSGLPTEAGLGPGAVVDADAVSASDCLADPVNSLTGAFTDSETDLTLPGPGLPFTWTRTYTSADTTVGRLGPGWTDSYNGGLTIKPNGDLLLRGGSGQQVLYAKQADGSFVGAAGTRSTLSSVSGGYQLVTHSQLQESFDAQGKLTGIADRNGNTVALAYDQNGRLATITDSAGRTIALTSNADGTLARVSVPDGRSVVYGYSAGRLSSVTDPANHTTTYHYDANGRLDQITDPNGHTQIQNSYGSDGRVTQQTDALGHTTTFSWDASTQTETATDARGNTWKDVYSSNVLIKRIDALTNTTQIGSDNDLNAISVTSPDGKTTTMTYDARGNLTRATAPASLGAQKTFAYNASNDLTSVTDGRNKVTSYGYDSSGNNTQVVQDGTTVAQQTFNGDGQVLTSTDGRGKTTTYTYDSNGNLASTTDPLGNKTTYGYDSAGQLTSEVDPRGNITGANPADYTTSYTYDAAGHLLTQTDPLGHTTTYTYDSAGNQTTLTDPNNHTTTTAYDAANRVTSVTAPDGGVTSYTYDSVGNRLTETDPNNHTTTSAYNADNEQTSVTSPKGEATTSSYDANGNLTKTVDPRGNVTGANPDDYATTSTYDAAGRLLTQTDPLGHTTTRAYDAVGNLTSFTDANNHRTSYTYDATGRILTRTAPDGGVTTYTYDPVGNKLTRKDANNHTTTYTYDDAGRLASKTSPLGQHWTYSYDPAGNLKTTVDANGNATQTSGDGTTTYGYDRAGRLTSIDYSDSTPDVTFAYDAAGNRTSMTDGAGTQTRTYDAADRLTGVTRAADSFSYTYDPAGNLTSRTYPDGTVTSYSYDADDQLATAASGGATTNYTYDVAGELTQTALPTSNGYVETRTYDRAGRLTELKNANGTSVLSDFTSTLDAVGNPTTIVHSGATSETATYTYDANDRLTGVCYQTSCPNGSDPFIRWTYDAVGNRLTEARPTGTKTYTYNSGDELTAAGSTSYSYDQNGNETAAGSRTFSYDLANRLVEATDGSTTSIYTYDGDGNRITSSSDQGTITHLWDVSAAPRLAIDRAASGANIDRFIYGNQPISMNVSGTTFYYHFDTTGSVSDITSPDGTPQWQYAYEPFGAARTETAVQPNAPVNRIKFTAALADSGGLYYLQAREYDATSGRFLSLDPLQPGTSNDESSPYAYVDDRPTALDDPNGQHGLPIGTGQQYAQQTASSEAAPLAYDSDSSSPDLSKPPPPSKRHYLGGYRGTDEYGVKVLGEKIKFGTVYLEVETNLNGREFVITGVLFRVQGPPILAPRASWTCQPGCGEGSTTGSGKYGSFRDRGVIKTNGDFVLAVLLDFSGAGPRGLRVYKIGPLPFDISCRARIKPSRCYMTRP